MNSTLFAFRDPYGVQPLHLGKTRTGWIVASEDCSFDAVGATWVREISPGECLIIYGTDALVSYQISAYMQPAWCLFQVLYFDRPDSHVFGRLVYQSRVDMGRRLAQEHPVLADIVVPVPDSGIPAARGFADSSGISFADAFVKSRYIHRTFISPSREPEDRARKVRMKLSVMRELVIGKRVVLVDDSIVRGTTMGEIVRLLRGAGATEVHVRITAPPVKWPCFYGVDMSTQDELIAARMDVAGVEQYIGANSLGYLSLTGTIAASGGGDRFCTACFSGHYPIL